MYLGCGMKMLFINDEVVLLFEFGFFINWEWNFYDCK